MNEYLMLLIKVLLIVGIILIGVLGKKYLIPYLSAIGNNSKYSWIASMAAVAVKAAEQTMADKLGTDRKAVVTKFLKELLISKNISISDEEIDSFIEAAVYAMNLVKKV